eukprot:6845506-Prymnesium_polylepis.1
MECGECEPSSPSTPNRSSSTTPNLEAAVPVAWRRTRNKNRASLIPTNFMASSSTVKSLSRQKFEATFVVPFQRENVFDELVSYFRPLGVPTDGPGAVRFGVPDGAPYTPAEDSKFEMGWRR